MTPDELELMLVASDISNRSDNFLQMAREAGVSSNFENGFASSSDKVSGVQPQRTGILPTQTLSSINIGFYPAIMPFDSRSISCTVLKIAASS